ncbi:18946_t:CDS:2 [Funneliformis geosporum]|nr:18946_t:CDS:2 [Funneliformis geosporum]
MANTILKEHDIQAQIITAAHENSDSVNEYIDLDFEFLNEE